MHSARRSRSAFRSYVMNARAELRSIMRGRVVSFVVTSLAFFMILQSVGTPRLTLADDSKINPTDVMLGLLAANKEQTIGTLWQLSPSALPASTLVTYDVTDLNTATQSSDAVICTSIRGTECNSRPSSILTARSVLGVCASVTELSCIEEVRIGASKTSAQKATLTSLIDKETVFAEDADLGIPRGSSVGRWRAIDGNEFLVAAEVQSNFSSTGATWSPRQSLFTMFVEQIAPNSTPIAPTFEVRNLPGQQFKRQVSSRPDNVFRTLSRDTYIEVSLRLPNSLSGWFNARISDGTVTSKPASTSTTSYTIGGQVARVYVAGNVIRTSSLPDGFLSKWCHSMTSGVTSCYGTLGISPLIKAYEAWVPHIGDKAFATLSEWSVRAVSWSLNECFKGGTGMAGLLATNAAIYDPVPPQWTSKTKSLDFTVASPHIDENGTQAVGTYTLAIPSKTIACLYGKSSLPSYALISVTSGSDGTTYSAVSTLSESNGWLNFSAKGFHYSSPTIRVAFAEKTSQIDATSVKLSSAGRKLVLTLSTKASNVRVSAVAISSSKKRVNMTCRQAAKAVTCRSARVTPGKWTVTVSPATDSSESVTRTARVR